MKKLILAAATLSFVFAEPITETFSVKGMMCGVGCAKKVNKVVTAVEGVNNCDVDFASEKITVTYDNAKASSADIVGAVTSKTTYKCEAQKCEKKKGFWQRLFGV